MYYCHYESGRRIVAFSLVRSIVETKDMPLFVY